MKRKTGLLLTVSLLVSLLLLSGPAMSQDKSPAESQVDKALKFWDQMEEFTEEPGSSKDKVQEQKPAEEKAKTIQKIEVPPVAPIASPPPQPAPKPVTTMNEAPPIENRPMEAAPKASGISPKEETSRKNKDVEQYLDEGIDGITNEIAASIPSGKTTTVAVVDFNDLQGNVTKLGRYVSEELITRLFQDRRFKVIERGLLEKAIEELKFNTTDLVNPDAAQQLGKVLGAEALVTGTLTDIGRLVKMNARMIRVETGEVLGAASSQIIKTVSVEDMMKKELVSGKKRESRSDDHPAISNPEAVQQIETNDFLFELKSCDVSYQVVTCHLSITNREKDRELSFGEDGRLRPPHSRMFDKAGSEYHASNYKLADKNGRGVKSLLVNGVPINASIRFEGFTSQAESISLLELTVNRKIKVQFRDIPLIR